MHLARIEAELKKPGKASVVDLVSSVLGHASQQKASDIHIDPAAEEVIVRMRVDGVMQRVCALPKSLCLEVISRIKILAGLRTDEHQAAQDGRFRVVIAKQLAMDVRVSIVPTYHGENAVLRLLPEQREGWSLERLELAEPDRLKILNALKKSQGMVVVTGPTGSGKTTTLYSLLQECNQKDVSLVTIEDPIEYAVAGIRQIQVHARSGLTFANGLRSLLRQDPDIIMVGEIRDPETAAIAINTALTGHMILSTLHTNDAATMLPRLLDMRVEPYLVAATVNLVIGQRLVRKVCEQCKSSRPVSAAEQRRIVSLAGKKSLAPFFFGRGCDACEQTGYSGRVGIYEVLEASPAIREAILAKESAAKIRELARKDGMTSMAEDGIAKAKRGLTSLEEVFRVLHE